MRAIGDQQKICLSTLEASLEREGLDELVVARALAYIQRADLIIFIVDITQITPEDEEFAAFLRPYAKSFCLS